MVIIQDIQSRSKAKSPINWCFNIRSYITTVREANMNPEVSRYKNCWKQEHTNFVYKIQGSKCVKYNGSYKSKHYCHFVLYCKVNEKTNPLRLETKQGKPCPHIFRYSNCKGNHQADLNSCLFQKHQFNKEQYSRKYQELQEIRKQLVCLTVSSV